MEFSLAESLTQFQTNDREEYPEPSANISHVISHLISPESIQNEEVFESLLDLAHGFLKLNDAVQSQLVDLLRSAVLQQAKLTSEVLDQRETEFFPTQKTILEQYGYLIHVIFVLCNDTLHKNVPTEQSKRGNMHFQRACLEIESLLTCVVPMLELNLSLLFKTTPQLELFVGMFTRPCYESSSVENILRKDAKREALKILLFKTLGQSVKSHGHGSAAESAIVQNLTYYAHTAQFNAEFLEYLYIHYSHERLTDELLLQISDMEFSAKETKIPRAFASFIILVSERIPKVMLKTLAKLHNLLDSQSFPVRCAVIEACGNIAHAINHSEDDIERYQNQSEGLIEVLEQRFRDKNPFVRTKVAQAVLKLSRLTRYQQRFLELAVRSLEDRSTLVRRNCAKVVSELLKHHPFQKMHGSQLSLKVWKQRLETAQKTMDKQHDDTPLDEVIENSLIMDDQEENDDSEARAMVKVSVRYYTDAIKFIEVLHLGMNMCSNLLFSKSRTEVLEVMDLFVIADAFDVDLAGAGIKKMLHLIWMTGSNEEGKTIAQHLVDCYQQLFLEPPPGCNYEEKCGYIAKNLVELTYECSVADFASLEKLLSAMYTAKLIDEGAVRVLWRIYESTEVGTQQIHGSIIILSMLARTNHMIVSSKVATLLKGLESSDLTLCKFSFIALQRIEGVASDEIIEKIVNKVVEYTNDPEYFSIAEQAIAAVFKISNEPHVVASNIINRKTQMTFSENEESRITSLAQLLFVVGHVAVHIIVYLEKCETEFKKKKIESEKSTSKKDEHQTELEMIGSTSEDDFTDVINYIKERELLFGENSLLAKFGPMVEHIIANNDAYNDVILQRCAVLCLEKLMCVSSKFCEKNLQLLITVMEKSEDPIIRSNAVLGLGDMVVCFNNLVDDNIDFLYSRLHDADLTVQRTCLMTITFLILAGQVKVKGQLGQMAKCLESHDQGISDMCRMFFTELATKDNAIYNGFIDMFSGLSADEEVTETMFRSIMKFLLNFISKDKQLKTLGDKLFTRLKSADSEEHWNNAKYVLSLLPTKTEEMQTVMDAGFSKVEAR